MVNEKMGKMGKRGYNGNGTIRQKVISKNNFRGLQSKKKSTNRINF